MKITYRLSKMASLGVLLALLSLSAIVSGTALVATEGTLNWRYPTGDIVDSSPAIGVDGTIYVGSNDGYLYAINPDGTQKWAFVTGGGIVSSPAIGAEGTIYVRSDDGKLYAVNPNGTQKWALVTGAWVSSPAIGADGTIYVGGNVLIAVNPDGTQKWAFVTGGGIVSSPAIGAEGTIYVGSNDNYLYAINSSSLGLTNSPWPMFHHDLRHTGRAGFIPPQRKINMAPIISLFLSD